MRTAWRSHRSASALTALKALPTLLATRGLRLSVSRSNITDRSFCCTGSSPRAKKNDLVIWKKNNMDEWHHYTSCGGLHDILKRVGRA